MGDSTIQSVDHRAEKPAEKPSEKQAETLAEKQAETLADTLAEKPSEKLAEKLADTLAETLADGRTEEKKERRFSRWLAVLSLVVAIGTVATSAGQMYYSGRQKTVSEQEQLVKLTTAIAGQLAQEQTAKSKATGKLASGALSEALIAKLTVEGQAGIVLIDDLENKDKGVAGYEYIEVAQALAMSGDKAGAIDKYKAALKAQPNNTVTRTIALRYMGVLYYGIGHPWTGHQSMMRAAAVFSKPPLETRSYIVNAIAQAYLVDAYYMLAPFKGCSTAWDDAQAARKALGSYAGDSSVKAWMRTDKKTYRWANCVGSL